MNRAILLLVILVTVAGGATAQIDADTISTELAQGDVTVIASAADQSALAELTATLDVETETDVDDATTNLVIVVGGPCAQPEAWELFSPLSCETWPYDDGEGIIEFSEEAGMEAVLIAGTTDEDTIDYTGRFLSLIGESEESGNTLRANEQFFMYDGQTRSFRFEGETITFSELEVDDDVIENLDVNGESFRNLEVGDDAVVADGVLLLVIDTTGSRAGFILVETDQDIDVSETDVQDDEGELTLEDGDTITIIPNGAEITLSDLEVDDDEVAFEVEGDVFDNLEEDEGFYAEDMFFRIENIDDDSAEIYFRYLMDLDIGDDFIILEDEDATVEIDGDDIDFEDLEISGSTITLSIDGDLYEDLEDGDEVDLGSYAVEVTDIDSPEVVFEVIED